MRDFVDWPDANSQAAFHIHRRKSTWMTRTSLVSKQKDQNTVGLDYVFLDKPPGLGKETFCDRKGDCEDYAKYVVLTAAGLPRDDLRLLDLRL